MNKKFLFLTLLIVLGQLLCQAKTTKADQKPNIILIMADDMGYECLGVNGSLSYKTPNLDRIASHGIRFSNCIAQPLCTPSRVKIMTGKYNYRNYEYFGYLNPNQKTFGNYLQDAGYKTCVAGKWQLNGLYHNLPGNQDINRPYHFGFDEYCLWQLVNTGKDGERYSNPLIIKNGNKMEGLEDSYGPDIFSDFVCDFIDRNTNRPFFIYYPMVLVHGPFVPTPGSPEWNDPDQRYENDTRHFKEMVEYADKIVGKIERTLKDQGLLENTILIFTGDNGTHKSITTETRNGMVQGGKSLTVGAGCHVPLIVSCPKYVSKQKEFNFLIEFSDFLPTLADIAGISLPREEIDGKSFFPVLKGDSSPIRETVFVHYDPQWGQTDRNRNRFSQTIGYKLYQNGQFFNIIRDPLEKEVIDRCSKEEKEIKSGLQKILDKADKEVPWVP